MFPPDKDHSIPQNDAERAQQLLNMEQGFCQMVPYNRALGLRFVGYGEHYAILRLPFDARFVGNPEAGILHGGVISALVDATCGVSVFLRLSEPVPIATLDLRIDYLRPAEPGRDVHCRADCYKVTRNVAFVRAGAYHDDPDHPVATAAGTFMISTAGMQPHERHELHAQLKGDK